MGFHQWQDHSPWSVLLTLTLTTSATTTTATPGLVVATVSPSVSVPVATPAQESVAGPSCSFSGGSFYSGRQTTGVLAKRARVEPPKKTPKSTSKKGCGKGGKNKRGGERGKEPAAAAFGSYHSYDDPDVGFTPTREPGLHLEVPNLRNTLVRPLDFSQLYFTPGLVDDIVQHTNSYAYIKIAKENSTKRSYTESNGSWRDTTPSEILKLIGLYFGILVLWV